TLSVSERLAAVLLRPGARLVLNRERDGRTQSAARLRRHRLNVTAPRQVRPRHTRVRDEIRERPTLDHRQQVTVDVARLVLTRGGDLDARRSADLRHRLARGVPAGE